MEVEAQQIAKSNIDRWTIDPQFEIVPERGLVRLTKYKKDFADDVIVKRDGVPFLLKYSGRALHANEVLRERADLALDQDGNLLGQGDFQARYVEWLDAFTYPEGHETALDPIPEVGAYVSERQDTFSESSGYIAIDFDPRKDSEWEPSEKFDTEGREIQDETVSGALNAMLLKALADKLSPEQAAEILEEGLAGAARTDAAVEISEKVEVKKNVKQTVLAPCGKGCKGNAGMKAHMRHCKHELCGGTSVNTKPKDEAA